MIAKTMKENRWLLSLILIFHFSASGVSAQTCEGLFSKFSVEVPAAKIDFRNPHKTPEILDVQGLVNTPTVYGRYGIVMAKSEVMGKSISEALKQPAVQSDMKYAEPSTVILEVHLPESAGGGKLRLTRLDTSIGSGVFNHLELLALLQVNPQLANALSFHRVEGHPQLAWIPDAKQLNYRLKLLAQARGFDGPVFDYQEVKGAVKSRAYLHLVAQGKLPFTKNVITYEVHDAMHAVAISALNGTHSTRKILRAASTRKNAIINIGKRLSEQFGEPGKELDKWLIRQEISFEKSDSIEYTMLLTILMTGNYDYGSVMAAQIKRQFSTKQNSELTLLRVNNLLRIYSYGLKPLEKFRDEMLEGKDPETALKITQIFNEEMKKIVSISEADINQGSTDLMDFFAQDIFSPEAPAEGKSQPSRHIRD